MGKMLEEALKCAVVIPYLDALGVSPGALQFERSFEIRLGCNAVIIGRDEQADVLRGRLDVLVRNDDGDNLFVMELKRPGEPLTKEDADQGVSYARQLRQMAPFVLVTNGEEAHLYDTLRWAEILQEEVPARWTEWKGGRALATVDDLLIRYQALRHFLGYSTDNVRLFCDVQRAARMGRLKSVEGSHDRKYLSDAYVPRREVRDLVAAFLHDASPAFVLAGSSGTGKTNEMCALAEQLAGDHLVLFFNGAELYGSLARTLTDEFNWHFSDQLPLPKICQRLAAIAERLRGRVVILLDAVDETGVQELSRELSDLTGHLVPLGGTVKLIASLKTELWGAYARIVGSPSALAEHCFKPPRGVHGEGPAGERQRVGDDVVSQPATPPSAVMGAFNAEERDLAVERYRSAFHLRGALSAEMLEAVSDPFMLRVVAEAYAGGGAEVPRTAGQWELLRRYVSKKLEKLGGPEQERLGQMALLGVSRALADAPVSAWAVGHDEARGARFPRTDLDRRAHTVREEVVRRELHEIGAETALPNLIAHGFLFEVLDPDGRRRLGFQYDRVRDYVVAALLHRFDTLTSDEFGAVLRQCVASPVSRSALHFYMRNATPQHRTVFATAWPEQWMNAFLSAYERIRDVFGEGLRARIKPRTRGQIGVAYSASESGVWALALIEAPNAEQRILRQVDPGNLREIPIPGSATELLRPDWIHSGGDWGLFVSDPAETAARMIWEDLEQIVREGGLDEAASEVLTLERALAIIARHRSELRFQAHDRGTNPLIRQMSLDLFPIDFGELRRRIHSFFGAEFYRQQWADRQTQAAVEEARSRGEVITTITIHYPPDASDEWRRRGAEEAAQGNRFPPPWRRPPHALAILDGLLDMLEHSGTKITEHYLPAPDVDEDGEDYVEVAYSDERMKALLSAVFCHALRELGRIIKGNFGALASRFRTFASEPVVAVVQYTRPSPANRGPIGGGGLAWALASHPGAEQEWAEVYVGDEDRPFLTGSTGLTGEVRTRVGILPTVAMHFTHFSSVIRPWREVPLTWPQGSSEGSELTPVRCWVYGCIAHDLRDIGPGDLLAAASLSSGSETRS
jgi:hypothetical protein